MCAGKCSLDRSIAQLEIFLAIARIEDLLKHAHAKTVFQKPFIYIALCRKVKFLAMCLPVVVLIHSCVSSSLSQGMK